MFLYRWTVEKIDGFRELRGFQMVIGEVSWELEIRDTEDHSVHYIRDKTLINTDNVSTESFVDYLELNDTDVLQWVWDVVGKEATEERIRQELDALRNPPRDQLSQFGMPWRGSCCPDGTGMPEPQP